jgi:hypothetical protein
MSNEATGVRKVVEELQEQQVEAWREGAAEQLALIPVERPGADPDAVKAARKGGRPAGARNRRTTEMLEYLRARYTHPLIGLAEAWSRPVAVLAAELGCDLERAFALQLEAMKASLPYWASKQPVDVAIDAKGVVQLIIGALPADEGEDGDQALVIGGTLAGPAEDTEESEEDQ